MLAAGSTVSSARGFYRAAQGGSEKVIDAQETAAGFDEVVALKYLDEQNLTRRPMKVEKLFAPNISPGLENYLKATGED